jgi:phosphoribosylglycinamide formyltransferase 1
MHGNVLNIHPALLPEFGGKGMYGSHVHAAVLAAKAHITGATVHLVTENYDEGGIIAQSQIDVPEGISVPELASRVKELEHQLYPHSISVFIRRK